MPRRPLAAGDAAAFFEPEDVPSFVFLARLPACFFAEDVGVVWGALAGGEDPPLPTRPTDPPAESCTKSVASALLVALAPAGVSAACLASASICFAASASDVPIALRFLF